VAAGLLVGFLDISVSRGTQRNEGDNNLFGVLVNLVDYPIIANAVSI